MTWMAVDIDMDDDPKIELVDGFARAILQYIWRRAKRNDLERGNCSLEGVSPDDGFIKVDRWDAQYLARKTAFAGFEEQIAVAMGQLSKKLVKVGERYVIIPNWRKYQKKVESAKRVQDHRQAKKEQSTTQQDEMQCNEVSRDVTQRNETERDVRDNVTTTTTSTKTTTSEVSTTDEDNTKSEESRDPETGPRTFIDSKFKEDAFRLADFMVKEIQKFKPDYRYIQQAHLAKTRERWAIVFERMLRLDKLPPRRIAEVLRWAYTVPFWQPNILSADKLKHHFQRLEIEMKNLKDDKTLQLGKATPQDLVNNLATRIAKAHKNNSGQQFDMLQIQSVVTTAIEDKLFMPIEVGDLLDRGHRNGIFELNRMGKIVGWKGQQSGTLKEILTIPNPPATDKEKEEALDNLPPAMKAQMAFRKKQENDGQDLAQPASVDTMTSVGDVLNDPNFSQGKD